MNFPMIITFLLYFMVILTISSFASRRTKNLSDFILGGRSLSGAIAALGAGASDMSGWLLLGLPGAVYAFGIDQIWIPLGLSIGAFLNWQLVAKRLRIYTEKANDSLTIPAYFENRFPGGRHFLRLATALIILVFFMFYASAGFVGGAVLFQTSFNISYPMALFSSAFIIILYTGIGGFLAVSWIDFFQGTLMFFALIITPISAYHQLLGIEHLAPLTVIGQMNPNFLNAHSHLGLIAICSLLGWGLGYCGQPHILVRFMACRNAHEIYKAGAICMTWMVISLLGAIATGLLGLAFFSDLPLSNPETVFLELAKALFNPWITGVLFAAVLSAIMSTISAQLLASSSALTEDAYLRYIRPQAGHSEQLWISRMTVFIVAAMAMGFAYNPHNTILNLVSYAWAGLGSAFGPVILLSLYWKRMTRQGALSGMAAGAFSVIIWNSLHHLGGIFALYEMIPAFILNVLTIIIVSLKTPAPSKKVTQLFDEVIKAL